MATTAIWKIYKRLDHVLDYIANIEKICAMIYDGTNMDVVQELFSEEDCILRKLMSRKIRPIFFISG